MIDKYIVLNRSDAGNALGEDYPEFVAMLDRIREYRLDNGKVDSDYVVVKENDSSYPDAVKLVNKASHKKDQRIAEAYQYYNGVWPKELTSGVMFWNGSRITLDDFVVYRKLVR